MIVTIIPDILRQQVAEGWKLKTLAEHYNLPNTQIKKALKALDLTIRKFHSPKFVFAEEEQTIEEEINQDIEVNEEYVETPVETFQKEKW